MNKYLILVNKNNMLDKDYKPDNLVKVKIKTGGNKIIYLEKKTYKHIKKLLKRINKLFDTEIVIDSGYRSYFYQEMLLNDLIKEKGIDAYKSIAIPGSSEHQTGLAVDIGFYKNGIYDENFKVGNYLEEFKWLNDNSYKYGFIIRYPKDKCNITGYIYEPWHLRYVGKYAKCIYKNNLCLEEYLNIIINMLYYSYESRNSKI